ncbi:MAG: alpha-N-acetylglucosaminidase [Clostridia bacterium]|nr:alpha-N-acetylglucosaminidase [Clostridia bacterium]
MKEFYFEDIEFKNGEAAISLGEGKNISRVIAELSDVDGEGSVILKYAQSGVLDVLLRYGKQAATEKTVFDMATPICSTHIFLQTDNTAARIKRVTVLEAEDGEGYPYPHYFDTDLKAMYALDGVCVKADTEGELFYTVYTSTDGQSYSFLCEKKGGVPHCDLFSCDGREARYLRVLVTYHTASPLTPEPLVTFSGRRLEKQATEPVPVFVPDFCDTPYAAPITAEEALNYLYGIVERRVGGEYKSWFSFGLLERKKHDFFEISERDGKIVIEGSCGVAVAAGLNHYLKHYCRVHLSQVGEQTKMPATPPPVKGKIRKETKADARFAYNACVHSYTMAFWDKDEWQKEIDLLALSGINVVLDTTALEEVWRRFLGEIGYSHSKIKDLLSGPAYYAWQWIGNQMGQGSPLPDSWFARRTDLARRNHRIMRALGMEVVLPGFSGMVPNDIAEYDPDVKIIPQGIWCSFTRPDMLHPDHPSFDRYADLYYGILQKVFGKNRYFTDALFHEGGNRAGVSERRVAAHVLGIMLKVHPDAVWVINSWQNNPSSELLAGIDKDKKKHLLVLDLYGEKAPNYKDGCRDNPHHGYAPEFDGTPWVLCMLSNFGGRVGLHGHLDNLIKGIPTALNGTEHCVGVGMVPEASENNPVLYDFLFDCIWQDDANAPLTQIDCEKWLSEYACRRYGVKSPAAERAWNILAQTVYKASLNMLGQGAPEAVTNARPARTVKAASAWGNSVISYDKSRLAEAEGLLASIYDEAKDSTAYLYDLSALSLQVLANKAQDLHADMVKAFDESDASAFDDVSSRFLEMIKKMDAAAAASPYFRLDRWTDMAEKLAADDDDFTKRIFLYNARALVTTWGSYHSSEIGRLHDYSNRTWSGLLGGIYYDRWARWISDRQKELRGDCTEPVNWFDMEWKWVWC